MNHAGRDARAAVQHQGDVVCGLMNALQRVEVKPLPVGGVHAVDIADARGQKIHPKARYLRALSGVRHLACANHAVLFAADGAHLGLDRGALRMREGNKLPGLFHVLFNGVVAAVEHDGGEACRKARLRALIGAVVQMQGHRHGDAKAVHHGVHHGRHRFEARHVFARAFAHAKDYRALQLFGRLQNGLCPLQVVDVEVAHGIVAVTGLFQHFRCIYQHSMHPPFSVVRAGGAPAGHGAFVTKLTNPSISHGRPKSN